MITITKVGSLVKIDGLEGKNNIYEYAANLEDVRLSEDETQLYLRIGGSTINYKPLSGISIGGVVPTNAATVQSALATVFPPKTIPKYIDPLTRAQREGFLTGATVRFAGTWAASRTYIGELVPVTYGEAFFCTEIIISTNKYCEIQLVQSAMSNSDLLPQGTFRNGVNGTMVIPINRLISPTPDWTVYTENGDGTTAVIVTVVVNGYRITDDFNYDAAKTILWVGDSIVRGSGLSQSNYLQAYDMYTFRTRDLLRSLGYDCRLVVKAIGGTNSSQGEITRKRGMFDVPNVDMIFYQYGTNDGGQAVAAATYNANFQAFIDWAKYKYPAAKIVMCGPPPNQTVGTETALATLRTNMQSIVTADTSGKVFYCNLGTAFTATDSTKYVDGTHPNLTGIGLIYTNCLAPFINTNYSSLK